MYAKGTPQHEERHRRRRFVRRWRQGVLLLVLLVVATWGFINYRADHHTFAWDQSVSVAVIALLDDHGEPQEADWFIQRFLSRSARPHQNLREVEEWIQQEYTRYTGDERPMFEFFVRGPLRLKEDPPTLPSVDDSFYERWRGVKDFVEYFKELAQRDELNLASPDITLFVYFYDVRDKARHELFQSFDSLATRRDRMGIVFFPMTRRFLGHTTAVVAHELCHPLGASDKYDGNSVFPEGYAEPNREPRFPQPKAEIMALGRPVSAAKDAPVRNLNECVVGSVTAEEMNWQPR